MRMSRCRLNWRFELHVNALAMVDDMTPCWVKFRVTCLANPTLNVNLTLSLISESSANFYWW